jgi:8-oxo-dGTP pyrophosphatase MutT (NUDIX family)
MSILDKKKDIKTCVCKNCGLIGHEYNFCKEPITSWGIVLVKVLKPEKSTKKYTATSSNFHTNNSALESCELQEGIKISNKDQLSTVCTYIKSIQFLLVRRKHSLGYMEFVRGKYLRDNVDGITYLFQQMTPLEIHKLKTLEFDDIWIDMWGGDVKKITLNKKEHTDSKHKFECLKNKTDVELGLNFYIDHVKPYYETPEWGFPKGRKSKGETDLECGIREFCEETGYEPEDINILTDISPIVEDIIGTNGVSYRHIYFLAEDISSNVPSINDSNNNEIGNIGYFSFDDAYQLIREYHVEKRAIIRNVFMYFTNELCQFGRSDENLNTVEQKQSIPTVQSWTVDNDDFF